MRNPSSLKSISPSFATSASIRIEHRALAVILPLPLALLLSSTVDTTPLSRYPASLAHFTNIRAVCSSFVSTANMNGSNRSVNVDDDFLKLSFIFSTIKLLSSSSSSLTNSCETNTHSPPFLFSLQSSSVLSAKTETRPEHELVVNIFSHAFTRSTNSRTRSSTRPARLLSSSSSSISSLVITKLETVALFLRSKLSSFCIILVVSKRNRNREKRERNNRGSVHLFSRTLSRTLSLSLSEFLWRV